ncbi:MAG: phosphate uptake regulator PhoU [Nanoarchaeota archaeon]
METRKLIGFGRNSFVISLPKDWVLRNKLKKGDELFVTMAGDNISLSPNNLITPTKPREVAINVDGKGMDLIETEIVWAYLTNYDIITVRSEEKFDRKKLNRVKEILQNLAGLEIMEETNNKVTARDLINISQISVEKTIRRVDILVRGMLEDSLKSCKEDHYDSIFDRDADVNRLTFLAYRIMRGAIINPAMARDLNLTFLDIMMYWHILMRLEKIGDQAKRIARFTRQSVMSEHMCTSIETIYHTIIKDYEEVMKVYYTKKQEDAFKMATAYKEEVAALNKLLDDSPDPSTVNILENLKSMTSSIKHIARSVIGCG